MEYSVSKVMVHRLPTLRPMRLAEGDASEADVPLDNWLAAAYYWHGGGGEAAVERCPNSLG